MDSPLILNRSHKVDEQKFQELTLRGVQVIDEYDIQLAELGEVRRETSRHSTNPAGNWVYYLWLNKIVHLLPQKEFYELRTNRNNPLISKTIQSKLSKLTIGIAGLSVGSNIVRALVYAGIGSVYKIADPDTLETTNLNRITGNLLNLGQNKTEILARQIWEIDPYIHIELFSEGINAQNLEGFLLSPKLNIIFDEIDDLSLKFHLRLAARASKISYLMVTDNGYSAEIDVARFDLSPFEGGMEKVPLVPLEDIMFAINSRETILLSPKEEQALINSLIGSDDRAPEMKIAGKMKLYGEISGWPQLQCIAGVGAALAVYALKEFVSDNLVSGKKVISLN